MDHRQHPAHQRGQLDCGQLQPQRGGQLDQQRGGGGFPQGDQHGELHGGGGARNQRGDELQQPQRYHRRLDAELYRHTDLRGKRRADADGGQREPDHGEVKHRGHHVEPEQYGQQFGLLRAGLRQSGHHRQRGGHQFHRRHGQQHQLDFWGNHLADWGNCEREPGVQLVNGGDPGAVRHGQHTLRGDAADADRGSDAEGTDRTGSGQLVQRRVQPDPRGGQPVQLGDLHLHGSGHRERDARQRGGQLRVLRGDSDDDRRGEHLREPDGQRGCHHGHRGDGNGDRDGERGHADGSQRRDPCAERGDQPGERGNAADSERWNGERRRQPIHGWSIRNLGYLGGPDAGGLYQHGHHHQHGSEHHNGQRQRGHLRDLRRDGHRQHGADDGDGDGGHRGGHRQPGDHDGDHPDGDGGHNGVEPGGDLDGQ